MLAAACCTWLLGGLLPRTSAAQPRLRIEEGPYLQAVGEHEFTVVWTTNIDAVSWVELAPDDGTHFYNAARPKYYQTIDGRRPIGRLHRVRIAGLKPGTAYRYRVMQESVLLEESNRRILFGEGYGNDILNHECHKAVTLDPTKEKIRFSVVNDLHEQDSVFRLLYKDVKPGMYDFVCFNGDMTSKIDAESDLFRHYLSSASRLFAADTPLYVARGNHENRGSFAIHWRDYFPSLSGRTYFAFRQGPAYFIVLDSGEDKPDSDIRNLNVIRSDDLRREEARWLKRVVRSPEFKAAPLHIVFSHMPPQPGGWHGEDEVSRLFVPVLNEAGIDLMLAAHIHAHAFRKAGELGCDFPVVCNPNLTRMDVTADSRHIGIEIYNADGLLLHRHEFDR